MTTDTSKAARNGKFRVFLVEDHPVTREGFAQLINYQEDIAVCGQAGTVSEALAGVGTAEPDLVILDVSLPDGHGIEVVKDLRARYPKLPVLILTMHDESLYAERALRAGAKGYVMKEESTDVLMGAIHQVLKGGTYLSPRMRERAVRQFAEGVPAKSDSEIGKLTDRELEVFELIGRGLGTQQISKRLRLGVSTVETHRARIKEKLHFKTGTELSRRAVEWISRQSA